MHIVIAHYHLKPGGVTSVILAQSRELTEVGHRVTIASSCPATEVNQTAHTTVPELAYAEPSSESTAAGDTIAQGLLAARPDLVHWHNPLLGKNPGTLEAIAKIHRAGVPQLLHCHDFAEDARPALLAALRAVQPATLPLANNIHFAALTERDRGWLAQCGVPSARIHVVPNPQSEHPPAHLVCEPEFSPPHLVMPVRGIRRKNLGEAVLWARELKPLGGKVTVTLPPTSEVDIPGYNAWRTFANAHAIPFHAPPTGEVKPRPIATIFSEASAVLSTSVQEGHGFALHEPWLYQRAVISRTLPNVPPIAPALSYHRIPVPRELLDLDALRVEITRRTGPRAEAIWQYHYAGESIDFAQLPTTAQQSLLENPDFTPVFETESGDPVTARELVHRAQHTAPPSLPPRDRCALLDALEKCAESPTSDLHWASSAPLANDLLKPKHFRILTS
ncbi:glycosyltransferase [Sulfuriroseicoccus oceanibius]|uniref:Glycosyltransferase n=1 Tax=Sulfuriroseicoccus oceanibius TaxID=2707525 RepID=A0A6B3L4U5_9BACT|nr:glycosyltransferase [Sulfuriroseicoccus oceanibius]QQL44679.1 glycosyltransferase [Sulfuriroseicoccus oceanibius]